MQILEHSNDNTHAHFSGREKRHTLIRQNVLDVVDYAGVASINICISYANKYDNKLPQRDKTDNLKGNYNYFNCLCKALFCKVRHIKVNWYGENLLDHFQFTSFTPFRLFLIELT